MPEGRHNVLWDRWEEVDRIFDQALDLPGPERPGFLRSACGEDTDLLDTLTGLLTSGDRYEARLSGPGTELLRAALTAGEGGCHPFQPLVVGTVVGQYRLLRQLGVGGMAIVYEAERADGAFDRRVALKVLRRADPGLGIRFLSERQILSSLSHPSIAPLLDGGTTDDGRPWLAMELVTGEPIDVWADRRRLNVRARLEIFLQVVDAVQYAHSRLVVHRDLKPSNVLVDEDGRARLLDFGIARLLRDDVPEEAGRPATRWMTPEYAAPEQILARQVTTGTDIYSLGVLLYELLTGRRPFDGFAGSAYELERAICETPLPAASRVASQDGPGAAVGRDARPDAHERAARRSTSPSRLAHALEGDLDAILEKAMRKTPEERYRTSQDLADDIGRHTAGFPVRAREGLAAYRARKFVGRHRLGVAVAAGIATILLVSASLLARLQAQTAVQRDAAAAAADRAETAAENGRLVIDFLEDVFRGRDPSQAPSDTITARDLLAWGTERVTSEFAERPAVQAELFMALGGAHWNLGMVDEANRLFEQSVNLARAAGGDDERAVADALMRRGDALRGQRAFEEAIPFLEESVEIYRRLAPADSSALSGLASAVSGLGMALAPVDPGRAVSLLREAVEIFSVELGDEAGSVRETLSLAFVLRNANELDEAEALYASAIPRYRSLPDHEPATLAIFLNNLAYLKRLRGDPAGAEVLYREAYELQVELFGVGHQGTLQVSANLASAVALQGRTDEAIGIMRARVAAAREQFPEGHWRLGTTMLSLGNILLQEGRLEEAEAPILEAIEQYDRALGPDEVTTDFARGHLAVLQILTNRSEEGYAFLDHLYARVELARRSDGGTLSSALASRVDALVTLLEATDLTDLAARFEELLQDRPAPGEDV